MYKLIITPIRIDLERFFSESESHAATSNVEYDSTIILHGPVKLDDAQEAGNDSVRDQIAKCSNSIIHICNPINNEERTTGQTNAKLVPDPTGEYMLGARLIYKKDMFNKVWDLVNIADIKKLKVTAFITPSDIPDDSRELGFKLKWNISELYITKITELSNTQ